MRRLRLTFGRDERLKYISHLDTMRLWQRVFRRAEVPLAYSEGYNPHPKMSTAAPLAVGMTSVCELMDLYLESDTPISAFLRGVRAQLPPGLWTTAAEEVPPHSASLPSALRFAEYEVGLSAAPPRAEVESHLSSVLAASSLPRERVRDGRTRRYDLRPLVDDLKLIDGCGQPTILWMRLHASPTAAGRPEEVIAATGIEGPTRFIKRVGLILEKNCLTGRA